MSYYSNAILKVVFSLILTLLSSISLIAQNQLSVPFTYGAIGTIGTNPQKANIITNFQTLQISKAYFIQNSDNNKFATGIQGNDIPGKLRLVTLANKYVDIDGAVVWRDGNPTSLMGFIPATSLTTFNLSSYGGANFTISNTSNFVVRFNNFTTTLTDGTNLSGDAATGSVLKDLNDYLATSISSRPVGPVTVNTQTTASTTPTITGSVTLQQGEALTVEVNGFVYAAIDGLSVTGNTWSLNIPNSANLLSNTTYPVTAVITNSSGFSLSDNTTNELIISQPPTITISAKNSSNQNINSGSTTNDSQLLLTFTSSQTSSDFQETDISITGGY